eukprot:1372937-Rhodomonas_salina.1
MQAPTARRQSVDRAERGDRGHQDCMEGACQWRNFREREHREKAQREREKRGPGGSREREEKE